MVQIILYLILIMEYCNSERLSLFTQTSVIVEKCRPSEYKRIRYVTTPLRCLIQCSNDVACKRTLYCGSSTSSPFSCLLYKNGNDCFVREGEGTGCVCYRQNYNCENGVCNCPIGQYGSNCGNTIKDCGDKSVIDLTSLGNTLVYIKPPTSPHPFEVECNFNAEMTFIHNRQSTCTLINFNRTYNDYVKGFGSIRGEYWLGLDKISAILDNRTGIRLIVAMFINNIFNPALYKDVHLGTAVQRYQFTTSQFAQGSAGDGLLSSISINGRPFSTFDNDATGVHKCPIIYGGGWWYADDAGCSNGNPNAGHDVTNGVFWDNLNNVKHLFMYIG